jgi:hypothetical protein
MLTEDDEGDDVVVQPELQIQLQLQLRHHRRLQKPWL